MFDVEWYRHENGTYDFRVQDPHNNKTLVSSNQGYENFEDMLSTARRFGAVHKRGETVQTIAAAEEPTQAAMDQLALEIAGRDVQIEELVKDLVRTRTLISNWAAEDQSDPNDPTEAYDALVAEAAAIDAVEVEPQPGTTPVDIVDQT